MTGTNLSTPLLVAFLFCLPLGLAQDPVPKKPEKPAPPAVEAKVAQIIKAMAEMAKKPVPVHFKVKMREDSPFEDLPNHAEGELWSIGDKQLRMKFEMKVGSGMTRRTDLVVNEKGSWFRFPGEGVIFYSAELVEKIKALQKKGVISAPADTAKRDMNVLAGLQAEGFKLTWKGPKKIGNLLVDEIIATRKVDRKDWGSNKVGAIFDRCQVLVGTEDRIPRLVKFFSKDKVVRLQEYTEVRVGKKIDPAIFVFKAAPGEKVVPALEHPWMGPAIREALKGKSK